MAPLHDIGDPSLPTEARLKLLEKQYIHNVIGLPVTINFSGTIVGTVVRSCVDDVNNRWTATIHVIDIAATRAFIAACRSVYLSTETTIKIERHGDYLTSTKIITSLALVRETTHKGASSITMNDIAAML